MASSNFNIEIRKTRKFRVFYCPEAYNLQMKTDITYRKWLNLVIYLITAMIILLLIVQKMYNSKGQAIVDNQLSSSARNTLLPTNFLFKGIIINDHFFTQATIKQFINQIKEQTYAENELSHLLRSWSTALPVAMINTAQLTTRDGEIGHGIITLTWLDKNKQYHFLISQDLNANLSVWRTQPPPIVQYQFSPEQKSALFPFWFKQLLQQNSGG